MSSGPMVSPSLPAVSLSSSEINKLSDSQVWDMDPSVVCRAARKSWRSDVYDHFNLSLEHKLNDCGEKYIRFKFTCKTDPENHSPQYRAQQDTSSGTHNLQRKADACDKRLRARTALSSTSNASRVFSPARFRALLALWCARNHRPVELVQDELFGSIIDELRPGTSRPDRTTLSRDIQGIYKHNIESIRRYFEDIDHVHLAIDGWTAPTSRSYLGIVVIWEDSGTLCRAILEFVNLTRRHTGTYLAQKTADCLNKYNLGHKLLTVCMDNASNNDTFTEALRSHFPTFGGAISRVWCAAHVGNLVAKAYLRVFSKPTRHKRVHKEKPDTAPQQKRQRTDGRTQGAATLEPRDDSTEHDGDDESDSETDEVQEALVNDNVDSDKAEHDDAAVQTCVENAFLDFEKQFKIKIPSSDRRIAEQLIPKVAGLAKRAHKSAVVQHKFEECVATIPNLSRSKCRALVRRIVTRWNTDLDCLRSHIHFRPAVKLLTADRDLSLKQYELTDAHWDLAEKLVSELNSFERLTKICSETQVPSIHQVVPALLKLQDRLLASVDNSSLPPLLRVAARAALGVFDKYMRLFASSSIYWVALVMCPYYKLQWFKDRRYKIEDIAAVEKLVHSMFEWMSSFPATSQELPNPETPDMNIKEELIDDWLSDDEMPASTHQIYSDTIEGYLTTLPVSKETLRQEGVLGYWKKQQKRTPRVAAFALGLLSAPASSVDAEHAFSGGRLTINHLQHSMSKLTFEAKMAVGSWFQTPLLPSVDTAAAILADSVRT